MKQVEVFAGTRLSFSLIIGDVALQQILAFHLKPQVKECFYNFMEGCKAASGKHKRMLQQQAKQYGRSSSTGIKYNAV